MIETESKISQPTDRDVVVSVRFQLFGPSAFGKIVCRSCQPGNRKIIGAFDYWNNQTAIQSDSHTKVDVALIDDLIAVDLRIEDWKFTQGIRDGLKDERHVAELCAGTFCKGVFMLLAKLGNARHVYLINGGDVRGSASRLDHMFGDLPAHHRHLFDAITLDWFHRSGCGGLWSSK